MDLAMDEPGAKDQTLRWVSLLINSQLTTKHWLTLFSVITSLALDQLKARESVILIFSESYVLSP